MHPDEIAVVVLNAKIGEQATKKIAWRAQSLEEKSSSGGAFELLQELEKECRLSHPRLGDQRHEPAPRRDSIEKRSKRFPVRGAHVQEPRIRGHPEWLLPKFVVVENHSCRLGHPSRNVRQHRNVQNVVHFLRGSERRI